MGQDTTDNFFTVLASFKWPDPEPVTYRLYHDNQGVPLYYTMEALPGTFIEVDQATYIRASHQVRVVDGKLKILAAAKSVTKLKPDMQQGASCDPRDVCVIVTDDGPYQRWRLSTNDKD